MKKNIRLLIGLALVMGMSSFTTYATTWNPGKILLRNGDELEGDLHFNWKAEVIQFKHNDFVRAYAVDQVSTFIYFDTQLNTMHRFVAVDHCEVLHHGRPQFLEEITAGEVTVYRGLRITPTPIQAIKLANFDNDGSLMKNINAFSYVVLVDNNWYNFNEFYNTRWPDLIAHFDTQLTAYKRVMGPAANSLVGQMRLICKYNALASQAIGPFAPVPVSALTDDLNDK